MEFEEYDRGASSRARRTTEPLPALDALHLAGSQVPPVLTYLGIGKAHEQLSVSDLTWRLLNHEEWSERVSAVRHLERMKDLTVCPPLLIALGDPHEAVRAAAARALGKLGASEAIDALATASCDPSWQVRASALNALGGFRDLAPVDPLLASLKDEDASVRAMAVWALGQLKERTPISSLYLALHDQESAVREAALLAIGELAQPVPLDPVRQACSDTDASVRAIAEEVLQKIQELPPAVADTPFPSFLDQEEEPPLLPMTAAIWQPQPFYVEDIQLEAPGVKTSVQPEQKEKRRQPSPLRRRARIVVTVAERVLAAAVIVGICLGWFILNQQHTSTAGPRVMSTFFSHHASGELDHVIWGTGTSYASQRLLFSDARGVVQFWDISSQQLLAEYGPFSQVLALHWTGEHVLIAALDGDGRLRVYRDGESRPLLALSLPSGSHPVVAWSPDGTYLAVAANARQDGTIAVWELSKGHLLSTYRGKAGTVRAIAWSPVDETIASASDAQNTTDIALWSAKTGRSILPPVSPSFVTTGFSTLALAWSPDAQRLAYMLADGEVHIRDRKTSMDILFATNDARITPAQSNKPWQAALAWSPDGLSLASPTFTGLIHVWNTVDGSLRASYTGHANRVTALAWSPDGTTIVSTGLDGNVLVWGRF